MTTLIVNINKSGVCKNNSVTLDELYKSCGLKKNEGLEEIHTFKTKMHKTKYNIKLFARKYGKSQMVNKYEFPPPVDNTILYGTLALVNFNKNDEPVDLTIELWEQIYENLFGGFEDITKQTENEDKDMTDKYDDLPKTKEGYAKDGFVVEDTEVESDNNSELSEEDFIFSDEESTK